MNSKPYLDPYIDIAGEHRLRIRAGNHEILMVISEGIRSEHDVLVALELSREALNEAYANDANHRRLTDDAMARRAAKLGQAPYGSLAAALVAKPNALLGSLGQAKTPTNASVLGGLLKRD